MYFTLALQKHGYTLHEKGLYPSYGEKPLPIGGLFLSCCHLFFYTAGCKLPREDERGRKTFFFYTFFHCPAFLTVASCTLK
jgi:hypothetical protein